VLIKHPRLSVKKGVLKGIPYMPEDRGDGNPNIGFCPIKGRPEMSIRIPEACDEPGLLDALQRINASHTAFFTSGCEKCYNRLGVKERPVGYVEFIHNSIEIARDENTYWQLLTDLDNQMNTNRYSLPVAFEYIVSPTRFNDHFIDGFSAAVYVRYCGYATYRLARRKWREAFSFLTTFLCSIPAGPPPLFYGGNIT